MPGLGTSFCRSAWHLVRHLVRTSCGLTRRDGARPHDLRVDGRILIPDGRVVPAETGVGFPEALHDRLSPVAGGLLRGEVLDACLDDDLGTCNGVVCARKERCVRNDTTCDGAQATLAMSGSTGDVAPDPQAMDRCRRPRCCARRWIVSVPDVAGRATIHIDPGSTCVDRRRSRA
jgi:hypothetical protein